MSQIKRVTKMVKRYSVGETDKNLTVDMKVVRSVDFERLETALKKIKGMVSGEASPRWAQSPETTATRGNIADICDDALGNEQLILGTPQ